MLAISPFLKPQSENTLMFNIYELSFGSFPFCKTVAAISPYGLIKPSMTQMTTEMKTLLKERGLTTVKTFAYNNDEFLELIDMGYVPKTNWTHYTSSILDIRRELMLKL